MRPSTFNTWYMADKVSISRACSLAKIGTFGTELCPANAGCKVVHLRSMHFWEVEVLEMACQILALPHPDNEC